LWVFPIALDAERYVCLPKDRAIVSLSEP
jgi:hypothetical protein